MDEASFKTQFKHFKNKAIQLDVKQLENRLTLREGRRVFADVDRKTLNDLGLTEPELWKTYELKSHEGLLVVKNVFTEMGQQYWVRRCVADYPSPPNRNNLCPLGLLSNNESWYDVCLEDVLRKSALYRKLRWVTLGYHHNWDTKIYSEERRSEFPSDLGRLSEVMARLVIGVPLKAEAAIVNFYYQGTTMNGHVDESEPNLDAPLLSFSFGDSALFLIGVGADPNGPASPVLLHSGDVVIMFGPSRLSIHGVPRVMAAEPTNRWSSADPLVADFISAARINMNVRQVSFAGETLGPPNPT